VALDDNLFDLAPYAIHETDVVMTLVDGEVVYRAP